ncbi:hypothetical protein [Amycolatopsis sp. NPDC003731]
MDPVSMIVAALVGGASEVAGQAVKDAYQGLKALLTHKFAGRPTAEVALAEHEKQPEIWREPLKDQLTATAADQDEAIVDAARKVLELVESATGGGGKYHTTIGDNAQGVIVGDKAKQKNYFGPAPE